MNIIVQRADLARALTAVSKAVEKRNTIPILGCVHLDATAGELRIRGTDLDIEITSVLPASVAEPGRVCVDAGRLLDIARKMAGDEVTLSLAAEKLTVKAGRSRFNLATLPWQDFPTLSDGQFDAEFEFDLAALVSHVSFAQSSEQTRIYICGIHLHTKDGNLVAVATDGHRMAVRRAPLPDGGAAMPAVTLPTKAVSALPKGAAKVSVSTRKIRVEVGDIVLLSKLIDAPFPDYERVIPTGGTLAKARRADLLAAADRVGCIETNGARAAKFSFDGPTCRIVFASGSSGEAYEEVDVEYGGEPFDIGFNYRYIADIMGALQGETVTLRLAAGLPGHFTADGDGLCVCMPMRH
jgi:DNA polymerase-3 subunit beta